MAVFSKRGFTVIELLVVIAVIGILASVVMTSVNITRRKAYNAKIKEQLHNLRNVAAIYYAEHGNYGEDTNDTDCNSGDLGEMFQDPIVRPYTDISNYPSGVAIKCVADDGPGSSGIAIGYAVTVSLVNVSLGNPPNNADHWCVDYEGTSKAVNNPQSNNDNTC